MIDRNRLESNGFRREFNTTMLIPIVLALLQLADSFRILVYSPAFAGSHTNFLARLADVLTDAGHNVTFVAPIFDESRRDQLAVRRANDVIRVDADDEMTTKKARMSASLLPFWTRTIDADDVADTFHHFSELLTLGCENLVRHSNVIDELRRRQFDVAIAEPISVCGLALMHHIGISKTILASSVVFFDPIVAYSGEPFDPILFPASLAANSDDLDFSSRYSNYKFMENTKYAFEQLFDGEQDAYRKLSADIPDWKELIPSASIMFTNSNPLIDFPRPILQKTVPIGGISVQIGSPLSSEWIEMLEKRPKSMLISFGTMAFSSKMPIEWRQNLLNVFASFAKVTFIWKYETDDLEWANGVDNIHFSKWVPQPALLADHRLSAFLTHGGLGSTNELAHFGKPAITVPLFGDQVRNAQMLSRHNGSILLDKFDLGNEEILRDAIRTILYDESFLKNAQHLAEQLDNQPFKPKELLVKYTEFVAKYGPLTKLDPKSRNATRIQRNMIDVYLAIAFQNFLMIFIVFRIIRCVFSGKVDCR
ncbi:unnamed protein product [Caenorhabditis bovis]|uniref:glucuronosyltransferase n=1 Tax=Caenorhabditis bovis TaxID=2654633 RepID=A0A8S1F5H2_9PELO|nr:unnamed protein product [Caenorhabditis bovis]